MQKSEFYSKIIKKYLIDNYGYSENMEVFLYRNDLNIKEYYIKDIYGEYKTLTKLDEKLIFEIIKNYLIKESEMLENGYSR